MNDGANSGSIYKAAGREQIRIPGGDQGLFERARENEFFRKGGRMMVRAVCSLILISLSLCWIAGADERASELIAACGRGDLAVSRFGHCSVFPSRWRGTRGFGFLGCQGSGGTVA